MTVMRIQIDDASDAYVEVDVPEGIGEVELLAGKRDSDRDKPPLAQRTLAAALDTVKPAMRLVVAQLQSVDPAVSEIDVQVGLRVGGETGLLLVRGHAESTFAVTLRWRRPAATDPPASGDDDGGDADDS